MKKLWIPFLLLLAGCQPHDSDISSSSDNAPLPTSLPEFRSIENTQERKQAFFDFLLPMVQQANQQILNERELVLKWVNTPNKMSATDQEKLQDLLVRYRVKEETTEAQQQYLLRRVNVVPPSLVLAQAANESAWGTSRFAQEGNNLFGQWCFTLGCGIIPGERNHRAKHEVEVFFSPFDSIQSYMRNLNSHPQYRDLRDLRLMALEKHKPITGLDLADGLLGYSERGEAYVEEIKQMIRHNQLSQLDSSPAGAEMQL